MNALIARLRRKTEELQSASGSDSGELKKERRGLLDLIDDLEVEWYVLERQNEELRRAQERNASGGRQYAQFYEFSPAGYVITDKAGKIVMANGSACEMLRALARELEGRPFSALVYAQDQARYFDLVRHTSGGSPVPGARDIRLVGKEGAPFFVQLQPLPLMSESKQFVGWQFSFINIDERKQLEQKLRQNERKYHSIFAAAKDAILLVDCYDGRLIDANRFACKLYGYSREEMLTLKYFDLSTDPERTRKEMMEEAGRMPLIYHKRKDGAIFPAEISASYYTDGDRRVSTVVIRNMTEREQIERALRESEEQLRHLSSRLLTVQEDERKAVATELHDGVVTSLAAIKYHVESLFGANSGCGVNHRKDYENLIELIRSTFGEASRIMAALRPALLDDLGIESAVRSLCRQYGEKHPQLKVEVDVRVVEELIPEEIKVAVFRMLQEALDNVAEHSRASKVKIKLGKSGHRLKLRIKDNGKSFDSNSDHAYRKGLGLASMKRRTELTGGTFSIDSRPELGTAISAVWPLRNSKAPLKYLPLK